MSTRGLPDSTHIGAVRLRVADLARSLAFYRDVLGLRVVEEAGGEALLVAGGEAPVLIRLHERPGAPPKPPRTSGLYHYAILLPERRALARTLVRLHEANWPIQGASDHLVSEALYLADPDGNGIEIYIDRPRESWEWQDGQIAMSTLPLDVRDLLGELGEDPGPWTGLPAGTTIGHVHLHVPTLEAAEAFYHGLIGFDVTVRGYPGALFLSAGGYHHHLGTNTWAGGGAPPASDAVAGMIDYEIIVPDPAALDAAVERLRDGGAEPVQVDGGWRVVDPAGVGVVLRG